MRPFRSLNAHHDNVIRHVVEFAVELVILKSISDVSQRVLNDRSSNSQVEASLTCTVHGQVNTN